MSSPAPESLIELKKISKTYHLGEVDVPVLHEIDLKIPKTKFTIVLGASGSGKSTMLNLIGGIDRPSSGDLFFEGENITQYTERRLTLYRRHHVGFVFQFYNLVPTLTARENVEVATELADDPMPALEALETVQLQDRAGHFPAQLSGGEQQRVAIARAIAKKPKLMLCDEPTGALDSKTSQTVLDLLAKLTGEIDTTIILITHAPEIAKLGHLVIHIGNGRIDEVSKNDNPPSAAEIQT